MDHPVRWTAPSPTWPALTGAADAEVRRGFNRPSLLRFATDTFMEDFSATLNVDPMRLGEFTARPETWRGPTGSVVPTPPAPAFARALQRKRLSALRASSTTAVAGALASTTTTSPVLKLYQPAHQRYYLVTASLVCQLPGLPDRAIDPAQEERATFVMRRLLPKTGVTRPSADPSTSDEYAFIADASGAGWRKLSAPETGSLIAGEEQLPLFRSAYVGDDGRKRKVLAGLVPVGRRDGYLGAAPRAAAQPSTGAGASTVVPTPPDPRITLLKKQVTEPWRRLIDRAAATEAIMKAAPTASPAPSQADREKTRREAREQIQTVSWYVLLDLAKYLQEHVPNAWAGIAGTASMTGAESALVTAIGATTYTRNTSPRTMRVALTSVVSRERQLETVTQPYAEGIGAWPSELFSLAPIRSTEELVAPPLPTSGLVVERLSSHLTPDTLETLVAAALPHAATASVPDPPIATRPVFGVGDPGWFVIRCVYERPQCGPLAPPLVSEPTQVFQLAGFFDPDAPARPIRIGLPADVSPAGLRKFDKNTAFMVSDMLCGHVDRLKGLTLGDLVRSVLPWPLHKDLSVPDPGPCTDASGGSLGMMCSISIPIVTICALMLLMIIVSLLDIIFRWVPYFLICFPVPGFKAKESA